MEASVWRVGRTADDRGKCLESGTNSRRSTEVYRICHSSNVRKRISEREEDMSRQELDATSHLHVAFQHEFVGQRLVAGVARCVRLLLVVVLVDQQVLLRLEHLRT